MAGRDERAKWQQQVEAHFDGVKLSGEARAALRAQILGMAPSNRFRWRSAVAWLHRSGLGYVATAFLAAGLTLALVPASQESADPLDEITTYAGKPYPPDFDLEGDASVFQEIVQELVPQESFTAEIPKQVQDQYRPVDGRFFSWSGAAGVRIHLVRPGQESLAAAAERDTLYIVRLTEKSEPKFPAGKTTKKFKAQAGKEKRVKAWREGTFGYALVQYVATNEANPSVDEPSP